MLCFSSEQPTIHRDTFPSPYTAFAQGEGRRELASRRKFFQAVSTAATASSRNYLLPSSTTSRSVFGCDAFKSAGHRNVLVPAFGLWGRHARCLPCTGTRGLQVASMLKGLLVHGTRSVVRQVDLKEHSAGVVLTVKSPKRLWRRFSWDRDSSCLREQVEVHWGRSISGSGFCPRRRAWLAVVFRRALSRLQALVPSCGQRCQNLRFHLRPRFA